MQAIAVRSALGDRLNRAILALGVTQIIAWGTTLYALGVLGKPIALETGWHEGIVYGGLTAALLVSGAMSIPVGRWLDRRGGQVVMTLGSAVAALGLVLVAMTGSAVSYLFAWGLVGLGMRMSLYDAAFAALVQMAPERGRRAISLLTLPGGLASTMLWPAGAVLEHFYGWRVALLVFAGLNLFVCVPLHWFFLKPGDGATHVQSVSAPMADPAITNTPAPLEGRRRNLAFMLFALVMSANAIVMGAMAVHLVPVLAASGLDARFAVLLASFKGVMQTLARLAELIFGQALHPVTLARFTFALLPVAFLILLAGGAGLVTSAIFVVLFGAANGLSTIVRGVVPLAIFGARGYGEMLGRLATPILLMNAVAPALFAALAGAIGLSSAVWLMVAASVVAVVAIETMARWMRRTAV
jgi:MFS family permease